MRDLNVEPAGHHSWPSSNRPDWCGLYAECWYKEKFVPAKRPLDERIHIMPFLAGAIIDWPFTRKLCMV